MLREDWEGPATAYDNGFPVLRDDLSEAFVGESNPHLTTTEILHICLKAFLALRHPHLRVFANMYLYYQAFDSQTKVERKDCAAPDAMIVEPYRPLGHAVLSYTVGREGPAPLVAAEVLSARTAERRDKQEKIEIYAALGVNEYILIDPSGEFLPQRLQLKRLRPDGTWQDVTDADGGITSQLGFRIVLEPDGEIRLFDAATGEPFARPDEAEAEIRALKARLADLERQQREQQNHQE